MKTLPYNLFLDDIRKPAEGYLHGEKKKLVDHSGIPAGNWDVVRDFDQFVFKIKKYGIPKNVSFDNDLCEEHYKEFIKASNSSGHINYDIIFPRMGIHALAFLLNFCKINAKELPAIYLHTANHLAREEMQKLILEFNGKCGRFKEPHTVLSDLSMLSFAHKG